MERRVPGIDVVACGKPHDFGEQLGNELRHRIATAIESLAEFELFRIQQPWWLPFEWYQQWSEWCAIASLKPPIASTFPQISERLEGMAEGARVRLATLYLFHAFESLAVSTDQSSAGMAMAGCSTVGVPVSAAADRRVILAHNLDGVDQLGTSLVVRENRIAGGYRSLGISCAPLSGMIDGVNEHGLAITYNWAFATDFDKLAAPVSVAIDDALANCRTVDEAARRITSRPRYGGAMLMLGDAQGNLGALELSNGRQALRRPRRGRPLFHTNQFRSPSMQPVQVARQAVYTNHAPRPLRGHRILESPERRDHRLRQLLRKHPYFTPEGLAELLADHGPDACPGADTLCMHDEHWTTQASIQLIPARRALRIAYGPACEARHVELAL